MLDTLPIEPAAAPAANKNDYENVGQLESRSRTSANTLVRRISPGSGFCCRPEFRFPLAHITQGTGIGNSLKKLAQTTIKEHAHAHIIDVSCEGKSTMTSTTSPRKISPESFGEAFATTTREHADRITEYWTSALKNYTAVVLDFVLPSIAKALDVQQYCNTSMRNKYGYYSVDSVVYEEPDTRNFPAGMIYVKAISVAIEHENNPALSCEEMHKLQLLNVPLKVLITYPSDSARGDRLLAQYEEIITGADWFGDIATLRRQLVIFGEARNRWRFYAYGDGGFARLDAIEGDLVR